MCAAMLASPGPALGAETGSLTQLSGAKGCIEESASMASDTCGTDTFDAGTELDSARSVAAYHGYVFVSGSDASGDNGIVVLKAGGAGLTPVSCIASTTDSGNCAAESDFSGSRSVITDLAVSPSGTLYATLADGEIVVLDLDTATGVLTAVAKPGGCVSSDSTAGCNLVPDEPGHQIVFSSNGDYAYSDGASGVLSYSVGTHGALTPIGCMDSIACGQSGTGYVDFPSPDANATGIAISPDGTRVYVADTDDSTIWMFDVVSSGAGKGTLALPDGGSQPFDYCVEDASDATDLCTSRGRGMENLTGSILTSPDQSGQFVYAVSGGGGQTGIVSEFQADLSGSPVGALSQLGPPPVGCISNDGTDDESTAGNCATGFGLAGADDALISPDGQNLYVVSGNESNGDLISLAANAATGVLSEDPASSGSEDDCYTDDGTGPGSGANPDCVEFQGMLGLDFTSDEAGSFALSPPGAATVGPAGSELYLAASEDAGVANLERTTPPQFTVSAQSASPGADGSVAASSGSAGAGCTATVCTVYPNGSASLSAAANSGFRFKAWSGGSCSGDTDPCTVSPVNASETDAATFVQRFTVTGTPTGTGNTVSAADTSANQPSCSGAACTVDAGDSVTLTATAGPGYRFAGWSAAGCPSSETTYLTTAMCMVSNVQATQVVTANFVAQDLVSGPAVLTGGTVDVSVPSADRTSTCSGANSPQASCGVDPGSDVTVTAVPASGYSFTGWSSGSCASQSPAPGLSCTITNLQASETDTPGFVAGQAPHGNVLYVAPNGSSANAGTESRPKQTLCDALSLAASAPTVYSQIVMATGDYNQAASTSANCPNAYVALTSADNGFEIYGGYSESGNNWQPSTTGDTEIDGSPQAVLADGATGVTLENLTLDGSPDSNDSAYGLRAVGASKLSLNDVQINAAPGRQPSTPAAPAQAASGSSGGAGQNGWAAAGTAIGGPSPGQGYGFGGLAGVGAPGTSGAAGGCGGDGGVPGTASVNAACTDQFDDNGIASVTNFNAAGDYYGEPGGSPNGGGGGGGGGSYTGTTCPPNSGGSCTPVKGWGGAGGNGTGGSAGGPGPAGTDATSQGDTWSRGTGGSGSPGAAGGGGGGGAGGAGAYCQGTPETLGVPVCVSSDGNGGGGGGGGGAGGGGGNPGQGGGGSFGLYLNGASSVTAEFGSSITTAGGGGGGSGSQGGAGGTGGTGGTGASFAACSGSVCAGYGGNGGGGGSGGQGGGGGGGAGGPSFAVFMADGTASSAQLAQDTQVTVGPVGQGGNTPGGSSGANGQGGAQAPCSGGSCTFNPTLPTLAAYAIASGSYVTAVIGCPPSASSCSGTATVTGSSGSPSADMAGAARAGKVLGTVKFKLKGHSPRALRIKLTKSGRKLMKTLLKELKNPKKVIDVTLTVALKVPHKRTTTYTQRSRLVKKAPSRF